VTPVFTAAITSLPAAAERRIAVRVTADALRQVRGGSPWLFEGSITSAAVGDDPGRPGDLAVVFDDRRKFAAIGFWDPDSPIRVKLLHHGAPRAIDRGFWTDRLSRSFDARSTLEADPDTTAFRCVHGENDALPGLVVDRYHRTLVVKLYSPIWFPHLNAVLASLVEVADARPLGVERVVLRLSRAVQRSSTFGLADGDTIFGEAPLKPVRFSERGLTMEADVVHGNKTGHFLDQRDNRALVRGLADGARVLDVFASTGGFSLSAAAGGAVLVHMVDLSEAAIGAAERNLDHNRHIRAVRACARRSTVGDAFAVLKELRRREETYDVVVLDPPSFAQNARSVPAALSAYFRLTQAGLAVLRPGGTLVQASCSSRVTSEEFFTVVHDAASHAGVTLHEIRRTGHPIDHPIGFDQGSYLKAVFARADR
jgi:23S rRNA (cytosine1962-C5)-methyltransferase